MKISKAVKITWVDSCHSFGWQKPERQSKEQMKQHSVGFIVHEDKETLTLSSCVQETGDNCRCPVTIPKVAILNRKTIKI